jgi:Xaa-Pro aminopeptidase
MSINGRHVPDQPDLPRMRRERHLRLQEQLVDSGLDALVLMGTSAVVYATGAEMPGMDSGRASLQRTVAIVVTGEDHPHLLAFDPASAPPELPADHLHPAAPPDTEDGAARLADLVRQLVGADARIGVDELPHPLRRALAGIQVESATMVVGRAKVLKTADEVACIRAAQHINETAMLEVEPMLRRPGVTQIELTATFVRHVVELGAEQVGIDPIWQVMPPSRATGPWTTHGDLAFPTPSANRPLNEGDVIWVDSGIHLHGYASDFGRTWMVGPDPTPSAIQQSQFERWLAVLTASLDLVEPGRSTLEVANAAIEAHEGDGRPWVDHFYLAHGVGTGPAEMPMIGTDLGDRFDSAQVLAPGMVLVFEPIIWDEGSAGYRSEEIVAVTDDGWMPLSNHPYDPFTSPVVAPLQQVKQ